MKDCKTCGTLSEIALLKYNNVVEIYCVNCKDNKVTGETLKETVEKWDHANTI